MQKTKKRITKRGGKSIMTTLKKLKKHTTDKLVPDLGMGKKMNSVASKIANSDNIVAKGLTKVGNTTKLLLNTDVTRQSVSFLKHFVNAGDVDRILVKNQNFLTFIEPQQITSMYRKDHDYEVALYEVKDTMFFDGTYIYRKEYLDSYLKNKKQKYNSVGGGGDNDGTQPVDDDNKAEEKLDAVEKSEEADMNDRSFLECGTMPNWSETASLAIINDYRLLDSKHPLLNKNKYETDDIHYISFQPEFDIFYRLLLNYKHQLNRSLWNATEQVTMKHIKHTLRVNYAFIKRNVAIKEDFKQTSEDMLYLLRCFGAGFTKSFTSGEINKTDEKREQDNKEEANIKEPIEEGEGETKTENGVSEGGGVMDSIQSSINYADQKWKERRIGTKLYKYYNYNFERYFTTGTSTKAIKNIGRSLTGIGDSEYIKPHFMDVEVAFAVLIAISMMNEYGLDNYDTLRGIDLTTYEIKYGDKTYVGKYQVQDLDANKKSELEKRRNKYKMFFKTGTEYEDENFVDHRAANKEATYLLEDNTEIHEVLMGKAHEDGQINVLAWITELYESYRTKKSTTTANPMTGGNEQEGGGDGKLYDFLNVVFDKCFRFMNQRSVWELEKQYLSDKNKVQANGKTIERNICDFMNYVNKTKIDASNVFSNTLLFNLIGTVTPGGVAMTPHLVVSCRLLALYLGSLLDMLEQEERMDLRNLFKDVYVYNLAEDKKSLAEIKAMYDSNDKRDVYIPLDGKDVVVEIRKFEESPDKNKCKIHFAVQDMKKGLSKVEANGENPAMDTEKCIKYKTYGMQDKQFRIAHKIKKTYTSTKFNDDGSITDTATGKTWSKEEIVKGLPIGINGVFFGMLTDFGFKEISAIGKVGETLRIYKGKNGGANKKTMRGGGLLNKIGTSVSSVASNVGNSIKKVGKDTYNLGVKQKNIVFTVKTLKGDKSITYLMDKIGTKEEVVSGTSEIKKKTWLEIYDIDAPTPKVEEQPIPEKPEEIPNVDEISTEDIAIGLNEQANNGNEQSNNENEPANNENKETVDDNKPIDENNLDNQPVTDKEASPTTKTSPSVGTGAFGSAKPLARLDTSEESAEDVFGSLCTIS